MQAGYVVTDRAELFEHFRHRSIARVRPGRIGMKSPMSGRARIASAMIDRAEFRVQRNRTLNAGVVKLLSSGKGGSRLTKSPHSSGCPPQQVSVRKMSRSRITGRRTE